MTGPGPDGSVIGLPALVVLVGAAGAGKTTWADEHFAPGEVVSSDRLRAAVGEGESDLDASADAFAVLHAIVDARLSRGLTVVVDTLGLDGDLRKRLLSDAHRAAMPAVAVVFDTPDELCRRRNRDRERSVPAATLTAQLRRFRSAREAVAMEGWDQVVEVGSVSHLSERPDEVAARVARLPPRLRFGLVLSSFPWADAELASRLAEVVAAAERTGFESLWVMDHLIQIPQVGRRWEPMLEAPTTLAWLAASTDNARLGTLVANTSLRNPAHLAKIVATLDVLSGGRSVCGLGAGWWERELVAYGMALERVGVRMDRLADTLQLLPLMWGPGTTDFEGRTVSVRAAECYPRPLQERLPLLVGGQGRRTLGLAARHADAVNLRGDPAVVAGALSVLEEECVLADRPLAEIEVTHWSSPLVAASRKELARLRERHPRADVASVVDHAGRVETLARAGVGTFLVSLPDLAEGVAAVERAGELVAEVAGRAPDHGRQVQGAQGDEPREA